MSTSATTDAPTDAQVPHADHGDGCRPRLRRGLAVTGTARGLVVEAVGRRHLFGGAAAADTLPRLLGLIDGSRDRAAVAAELGLDEEQIEPVLAALGERGLLEPGCAATARVPAEGAPPAGEPVAEYLSRTGPVAAAEDGSATALARLAAGTVVLVGPAEVTRRIAEDLRDCGVGRVAVQPSADLRPTRPPDLLVVCDEGTGLLAEACRNGAAEGFEVLRYAVRGTADGGTAIELGPRFRPGHTACADCFRTGHEQAFTAEGPLTAPPPGTVDLLAGLVADQVTAVLAGTATPLRRRELRRLELPDFTARSWTVVPEPGCPGCGPIGAGPELALDTVEWLLQSPPEELFTAGAPAAPRDLPEYVPLPTSPRRPLADPEPAACTPGVLDERAVSVLLSRTAGPAGADPLGTGTGRSSRRRWAPSGGNLGSVQLFLLTEAGWPGLPGTVFGYDAEAGSLIAVRSDAPPLRELLAGTGLAGRPVAAALVFTGAVHRLRGKYRDFSLRLTQLDSGCALAQAALVAAELGLRADLVAGDTGGLGGQLDLNPADQLVTGVIGIYRKDDGGAAPGPA